MKKIFFISALCALMFGCQKTGKQNKSSDKPLKLIFQEGDPTSLNPHRNISHIRCACLNKLLFEGLTRINPGQKAELAGASSVNISKDQMEYTFTIRKSYWSNGEPITAFDYERAWKEAVSPNSLCLRPDLFYVIKNAKDIRNRKRNIDEFGVKALDNKTLQIKLDHPCTVFLELLANSIFAPLKKPASEPGVFNGPFIIEKWNKTKNLILKKNPYYWGGAEINLNTIEINFIKDVATGSSLFNNNEVDWIGAPISLISTEDTDILEEKKLLEKRPSTLIFWIQINTKHAHFQSKHIRKALSYAIDRELINKSITKGSVPISFLPTSMAPFEQSFEYSPQKAKEHFEKGLQDLGISRDEFPEIELSYFINPKMKMLAQYIEQKWSKILNIRTKLIGKDWNYFRSSQEKGDYDIGGCYETALFPDPIDLLQRLEKKPGWENKEYKKIIAEMKITIDKRQRLSYLEKALKILGEEAPLIVITNANQTFAVNSHLKGYFFDYTNSVDFSRAYFD